MNFLARNESKPHTIETSIIYELNLNKHASHYRFEATSIYIIHNGRGQQKLLSLSGTVNSTGTDIILDENYNFNFNCSTTTIPSDKYNNRYLVIKTIRICQISVLLLNSPISLDVPPSAHTPWRF